MKLNSYNNGMKIEEEQETEKWREKEFHVILFRYKAWISLPGQIIWNVVVGIPIILCFFFTVIVAGV